MIFSSAYRLGLTMTRLLIVAPLVLMTQAMFVAVSAAQPEYKRLIFGEGGGSSCGVWS
jgi:hypothetical protein